MDNFNRLRAAGRITARNERKLDEMRKTVDEKLHDTLEKRLGESFKLVSDRLESVHKGLGEMQVLATGVGDLKRVLTNVRARGTWAEVQLARFLSKYSLQGNLRRMFARWLIRRRQSNTRCASLALRTTRPPAFGCPLTQNSRRKITCACRTQPRGLMRTQHCTR